MESHTITPPISDMHGEEKTQIGGRLQPSDNVEIGGRIKDSEIEDMERPGGRLAENLQIS